MECSLDLIRLIKQKPFFMVETHGREKMSKKLSKYISVLDFLIRRYWFYQKQVKLILLPHLLLLLLLFAIGIVSLSADLMLVSVSNKTNNKLFKKNGKKNIVKLI